MHLAVKCNNEKAVATLLEQGANRRLQTVFGFSPLHYAVASSAEALTLLLATGGCDVNQRTESGNTALHIAVEHENVEAVKQLVAAGAQDLKNIHDLKPSDRAHALGLHSIEGLLRDLGVGSRNMKNSRPAVRSHITRPAAGAQNNTRLARDIDQRKAEIFALEAGIQKVAEQKHQELAALQAAVYEQERVVAMKKGELEAFERVLQAQRATDATEVERAREVERQAHALMAQAQLEKERIQHMLQATLAKQEAAAAEKRDELMQAEQQLREQQAREQRELALHERQIQETRQQALAEQQQAKVAMQSAEETVTQMKATLSSQEFFTAQLRQDMERQLSEAQRELDTAKAQAARLQEMADDAQRQLKQSLHSDQGLCVMCLDEAASMLIFDCYHLCLCEGCYRSHCSHLVQVSRRKCKDLPPSLVGSSPTLCVLFVLWFQCPICNGTIRDVRRVYSP